MSDLSGQVALVTGGSRGIGRMIALSLAKSGADVAINDRSSTTAAREVCTEIQRLNRRCIAVRADVSIASDVERLVQTIEGELGSVTILVNNAGIGRPLSIEDITEKDWDELLAVNLKSMFLVTQAVLPKMREQQWGRIINLSSVAAQIGGIIGPHYAASKAGILGLTHFYASRLAKEGITVNAIAPALINTEMIASIPQVRTDLIPMSRFGEVEEVASVVMMLVQNSYITGQTINVNGGQYMS